MRPIRFAPFLVFCAAVACGSSNRPAPLAAAIIGPEGGELAVVGGKQAGLRLVLPAGAVTAPTEFRIVDVVPVGVSAVSMTPVPGDPFRIEPVDLVLAERATLIAPYRVWALGSRPPGNVMFEQRVGGELRNFDPTLVDVAAGLAQLPVRSLGQYTVVFAPTADPTAHAPARGTTVQLADGFQFAVEEVPAGSPFAGPDTECWHITGPGVDESLYFQARQLRGRGDPNWIETWETSVDIWQGGSTALPVATTTATRVEAITGAGFAGTMTALGVWNGAVPEQFGERYLRDVIQLQISLAWRWSTFAPEQIEYRLFLAPELGLLRFVRNGLEYRRIP